MGHGHCGEKEQGFGQQAAKQVRGQDYLKCSRNRRGEWSERWGPGVAAWGLGTELADLGVPGWNLGICKTDLKSSQHLGSIPVGQR